MSDNPTRSAQETCFIRMHYMNNIARIEKNVIDNHIHEAVSFDIFIMCVHYSDCSVT